MKDVRTIWLVVVVLFLCACPALGVVEFKDGLTHNINYTTDDDVYVDYEAPLMYTTVNLLPGGIIGNWWGYYYLVGFENSRLNILGGSIYGLLASNHSSQVNMSGGYTQDMWSCGSSQVNISGGGIMDLFSYGSSQVNMSGGSIGTWLVTRDSSQANISGGSRGNIYSCDSSQVNISGGSTGYLESYGSSQINISGGSNGELCLCDNSTIRIFGSDFAVDGQPFGYGELTSILGGSWDNEPYRHLTGTLLSGELIGNDFRIGNDARIILIPEPASIVLLCLGAVLLRRKRT